MINKKNEVSWINIFYSLTIGTVIMFLFGYFYNALIFFIPIIYFNLLIVIGFSILIAIINKYLSILFHVYEKKYQIITGLTLALIFIFIAWSNYILVLFDGEYPNVLRSFKYMVQIFNPIQMMNDLQFINEHSPWLIGSIPLNGTLLYGIWAVELLIILYTVYYKTKQSKRVPYSFQNKKYFDIYEIDNKFQTQYSEKNIKASLITEPIQYLDGIKIGRQNMFSTIYIFKLEDHQKGFITLVNNVYNNNSKSYNKKLIIENQELKLKTIDQLLAIYQSSKLSIFNY